MAILLAGDIGGTNTRLGIFSREKGMRSPLTAADFRSGEFPDFITIVREFLKGLNIRPNAACFGVAGPVMKGVAKITNLPWIIDKNKLGKELSIPFVRLLNDLEAIAYAVPLLEPSDLNTLNARQSRFRRKRRCRCPGHRSWRGVSDVGRNTIQQSPLRGRPCRFCSKR